MSCFLKKLEATEVALNMYFSVFGSDLKQPITIKKLVCTENIEIKQIYAHVFLLYLLIVPIYFVQ